MQKDISVARKFRMQPQLKIAIKARKGKEQRIREGTVESKQLAEAKQLKENCQRKYENIKRKLLWIEIH